MTNKTLLGLVKSFDRDWYGDFRDFPFEDTDVLIYDEDAEEFDSVDIEELKDELDNLLTYTIERSGDAAEDEEIEEAELWLNWNRRIKQFLELL